MRANGTRFLGSNLRRPVIYIRFGLRDVRDLREGREGTKMRHELDQDIETPVVALGVAYALALLGAVVAFAGVL